MLSELSAALQKIGLSQKQTIVLANLLERGTPMFVAGIARIAKLNRTTTYDVLRDLASKGLVSNVETDGVIRYQAIALELLPAYIEKYRQSLEESKEQVAELIPQIRLLRSKGRVLPKVQFFEGEDGVRQAYEDVLESNQEKFLRAFTGMDAVYSNLDQKWIKYFLEKRTSKGIRCIDITPETEGGKKSKADDEKYIRVTKFMPEKFAFDGDISIYDDKVTIASYPPNRRPIAVIIEDAGIATMMKKVFDFADEKTT